MPLKVKCEIGGVLHKKKEIFEPKKAETNRQLYNSRPTSWLFRAPKEMSGFESRSESAVSRAKGQSDPCAERVSV